MPCLTEFTLSMFADGELPDSDAREVVEHLASCKLCSDRVGALQEENRQLVHCLQDMELQDEEWQRQTTPAANPAQAARLGAFVGGLAVAVRLAHVLATGFQLPSIPDWLNPSNLSGQLNLLAGTIAYAANEGASMMSVLIQSWSLLILALLAVMGAVSVLRRSAVTHTLFITAFLFVLMVGTSTSASAMDIRQAKGDLTVAKTETVNDTLIATGDTVTIDGNVNGDLLAFGRQIVIHGNVSGNVTTFGQRVEITGTIGGTLLGAAQSVDLTGKVARDLYGFGQTLRVAKDATIGGNGTLFGSDSSVDGSVARDLRFNGGTLNIAGHVGHNVIMNGALMTLASPAHIDGDLTAHVPNKNNVHIESGAVITGKQDIELPPPGVNKYQTSNFYFRQVLWLATALVTGLFLFWLFPGLRRTSFNDASTILKSGGIGFLAIVATPVAAIIIGITVVGLPLALVSVTALLTGLYLAKITVAEFIGRALFGPAEGMSPGAVLGLLAGLVPIAVAVNLPYVGGLINFLLILIGFGSLLTAAWRKAPEV